MNTNETLLVQRVQAGNTESFSQLYDQYSRKIYDFIYFRTFHKETAEDLTSVTFTKAYEKIASFHSEKGHFGSWIYRIARNTVIDHYRTNKSTSDIFEAFDLSDKTNIEFDFDVKDKLSKVTEYLQTLSPEHRDLVIMRVWDNLSYREIAEITGKSEDSLKVSFSRIMSKMRGNAGLTLALAAILIKFNQ